MQIIKTIASFLFLLLIGHGLAAQSKASIAQSTAEFRTKYKADFLKEEHSPFYGKAEDLANLHFYKAKSKYQVVSTFTPTPDAQPFDMATYSGQVRKYVQYGWLDFTISGKARRVAVYQSLRLKEMEEYKDYLFIPFKDLTNTKTTYGGGRYIDLQISAIKEGQVVLDFNQCYNPYCAFKGGYSCPIPPVANHLDWAVKAGEKKFKGKH